MDKLVDADLTGADPQDFATNTLEIATPPDNPAGITSFQDLAEQGLQLVICAPEVPCGAATQTMADDARRHADARSARSSRSPTCSPR